MKTPNPFLIILYLGFFGHVLQAQDMAEIGKGKPVKLMGSLGVGGWIYNRNGNTSEQRRVPFSWYINGAPTLQIYSFTFPFSVTISEQQRTFSQPFNQYGVSPYYKWFTAHIGWRNMQFSDYSLNGQTFLGGGVEMKPGKLRLGAMYGRFRKAVDVERDTGINRYTLPNLPPSFKRMGWAAKVGIGSRANFIDLIVFKAGDVVNSISAPDSISGITPQDNFILGLKGNANPIKNLMIDLDISGSVVTWNKRRNDSIEIPAQVPAFAKNLIEVNYSTRLYTAGHASIAYSIKRYRIKLMYKRIDMDYTTLASNFMANDIQDITISPSATFAKGKAALSGTVGLRKDNLSGLKAATTTRNLINADLSVNPSQKWGFGFNYGNFGTSQANGRLQLNDSIRMSLVNQNYGFNFRVTLVNSHVTKNFIFVTNYSNNDDRNEFTHRFSQSEVIMGTFSYNINFTKKNMGWVISAIGTDVKTYANRILSAGPTLGFNKGFAGNKFKLNANANYQLRIKDSEMDGGIISSTVDLNYVLKKKHNFGLGLFIVNNTSSNISSYSFNEQRITLRYSFNF